MVTSFRHPPRRRAGFLTADLVVALGLLTLAVIPIAYGFQRELRLAQAAYVRAIAMEIVDGEMERLRHGAARTYADGRHPYPVLARAAANLPPGEFVLIRSGNDLRLEWNPQGRGAREVARQFRLP